MPPVSSIPQVFDSGRGIAGMSRMGGTTGAWDWRSIGDCGDFCCCTSFLPNENVLPFARDENEGCEAD